MATPPSRSGLIAGGRVKSSSAWGDVVAQYLGALVGCSLFRIIGKAPPTFCRERIWPLSMLQASLFFVFLIAPAANVLSGVSRTDAHPGGLLPWQSA